MELVANEMEQMRNNAFDRYLVTVSGTSAQAISGVMIASSTKLDSLKEEVENVYMHLILFSTVY